jgi:hypothetical protein
VAAILMTQNVSVTAGTLPAWLSLAAFMVLP